jgi:hypothetical protein
MKNENKESVQREPEELVSSSKYLLELIQMDLNFGRNDTIAARAKAAFELIYELANLYQEKSKKEINAEDAIDYYQQNGFSFEKPRSVGLYSFVCKDFDWEQTLVAITKNDYQILNVHCAKIGEKSVDQYSNDVKFPMWKKLA